MSIKDVDWKLLCVFLFLVVLSIGYLLNQDTVKLAIKSFLTWPYLSKVIWLSVVISFMTHYLSIRNSTNGYEGLIYKSFGKFADSAFAATTYGLALTTSASILKGVYIQQIIGSDIYFNYFGEIDIYSMLVVSVFLLGYSTYATGHALVGAIFRGASKNAKAAE